MIRIGSDLRIFVCTEPTDMRKGFDGLAGLITSRMKQDPLCGALFLFRNRRRDRLKVMYWDRDGMAIWYKRLERGCWQLPCDGPARVESGSVQITAEQLELLLRGIDLNSVRHRARFRLPSKPNSENLCADTETKATDADRNASLLI